MRQRHVPRFAMLTAMLFDVLGGSTRTRTRPAVTRGMGMITTLAVVSALAVALGLAMAGSATAGDDGPRVRRHDDARVSAGGAHTCAVKANGDVDCWGLNDDGQAADQTGPYVQVSAGFLHTCAVKANGDVDCWGDNGFGQATDQTGPYVQVSAGGSHTCAVKANGDVDCWGNNGEA